jgi:hypothetical protein
MQANPDKFQAIAVGNKTHAKTPVFKVESAEITCDEVVKLLGILNFNYHIKNICHKASQQLNVAMVRILLAFRDGTLPFSNNSSYVLS